MCRTEPSSTLLSRPQPEPAGRRRSKTRAPTPAAGAAGSSASPISSLLVRAGVQVRPVLRPPTPANAGDPPAAWIFTGGQTTETGPHGRLSRGSPIWTLDGACSVSGGDIVLRGAFAHGTPDGLHHRPGTLTVPGDAVETSADDRPLAPTRIWIEADPNAAAGAPGAIGSLLIDHCVLGPIRTRNGGAVESVTITDSIVQGNPRPSPRRAWSRLPTSTTPSCSRKRSEAPPRCRSSCSQHSRPPRGTRSPAYSGGSAHHRPR